MFGQGFDSPQLHSKKGLTRMGQPFFRFGEVLLNFIGYVVVSLNRRKQYCLQRHSGVLLLFSIPFFFNLFRRKIYFSV